MLEEDYDPEIETVQHYIHRRLEKAMKDEEDRWIHSVLYGDNSGGPLTGLFNGGECE